MSKTFQTCIRKFKSVLLDSFNKRSETGKNRRKNRTTHRVWKKGQSKTTLKLNIPRLNTNEGQRKYQHDLDLDTKLLNLTQAAPNTTWCATDKPKGVQTIIRQASEASVGLCKNNKHTKNYDHELSILTNKQKDLRIRIQNTKNTDQKSPSKTERNKILHNI